MLVNSRFQASRRELKYIIDERKAAAIRDFVRCYLVPDSFHRDDRGLGYSVCSLYLDNPYLTLYGQTTQGHKNRFKLRIRYYDDDPTHPAFAEIKRRVTEVIHKQRCAVTREGGVEILKGLPPAAGWLYGADGSQARSMAALHEFCRLRDRIRAVGGTYVYYWREAYVSPDGNDQRVTFDRQLQGGTYRPGDELRVPERARQADIPGLIMELKFTNRFPNWMAEMVRIFGLNRQSVPKYIKCVDALRISPRGSTMPKLAAR